MLSLFVSLVPTDLHNCVELRTGILVAPLVPLRSMSTDKEHRWKSTLVDSRQERKTCSQYSQEKAVDLVTGRLINERVV